MDKYQVLHKFWSSFKLKAYDETSVPTDAQLPYITFESGIDDFNNVMGLTASLWYRSTSWAEVTEKCKEIEKFIGRGGCLIQYDEGAMWIAKANPWAQHMTDSNDDMIRRIVLNTQVEFLS